MSLQKSWYLPYSLILEPWWSEYTSHFISLKCIPFGVLKQPDWPHSEEKSDNIQRLLCTTKSHKVTTSPRAHFPSVSNSFFFSSLAQAKLQRALLHWNKHLWIPVWHQQCMVRLLRGDEDEVLVRGEAGSPQQQRTHSLCLPDPPALIPGPSWPLSHCSAQMWKLLHAASRDLDLSS